MQETKQKENLTLYNKVKAVPDMAKKKIAAGRLKGMTDINPMWRIKTLTEQFGQVGVGWYVEILKREIVEGSDKQKVAFIAMNLFVKVDETWSYPIYGEGGASFIANERNGQYTNDEAFKMAYTDAISVCCKMLGFAADVYFEKDQTKYMSSTNTNESEISEYKIKIEKCKTIEDLTELYNWMPATMQSNKVVVESIKQKRDLIKEQQP